METIPGTSHPRRSLAGLQALARPQQRFLMAGAGLQTWACNMATCWVDGEGLPEAERLLVEFVTVHHHVLWMVKVCNIY